MKSKPLFISHAVRHFHGTEYEIWAGFELVGSTENFGLDATAKPLKSDN